MLWNLIENTLRSFGAQRPAVMRKRAMSYLEAGNLRAAAGIFEAQDELPRDYDALVLYAHILSRLGRWREARALCARALQANALGFEAHFLAAQAGAELKDYGGAERSLRDALRAKPDSWAARLKLGFLLQGQDRHDEALQWLKEARDLAPHEQSAQQALADALRHAGKIGEAADCYRRLLAVSNDPGLEIKLATSLPVIASSESEIDQSRERLMQGVAELKARAIKLENPLRQAGTTLFQLAYHGKNNAPLQAAYADLIAGACPSLRYVAPHCAPRSGDAAPRPRIGFVSRYLHGHTIGRLLKGVIQHLAGSGLDVTVFTLGEHDDAYSRAIARAATRAVLLRPDLADTRAKIAQARLDALIYPDIGMDPFTYYLAYSRLAPLQAVAWGHPDTTGIPAIDCFVSSREQEADGAAAHYTERLVLLEHALYHLERPPRAAPGRAECGLPATGHLYVCPQSFFKLHPAFDRVWSEILRRDPDGWLVLPEAGPSHWKTLLVERWRGRIEEECSRRVIFVPRRPLAGFQRLLASCDAMLDPFPFGGGATTLDAFAQDLPVVTRPGSMMCGRFAQGCCRRMHLDDLVARDDERYVALALRLGTDPQFNAAMRRQIAARSDVLFDDYGAAAELRRWLLEETARS